MSNLSKSITHRDSNGELHPGTKQTCLSCKPYVCPRCARRHRALLDHAGYDPPTDGCGHDDPDDDFSEFHQSITIYGDKS